MTFSRPKRLRWWWESAAAALGADRRAFDSCCQAQWGCAARLGNGAHGALREALVRSGPRRNSREIRWRLVRAVLGAHRPLVAPCCLAGLALANARAALSYTALTPGSKFRRRSVLLKRPALPGPEGSLLLMRRRACDVFSSPLCKKSSALFPPPATTGLTPSRRGSLGEPGSREAHHGQRYINTAMCGSRGAVVGALGTARWA